MNNTNDIESEKNKDVGYSIRVKANLNIRITNHIRNLGKLQDSFFSKKRWLREAVKEKIQASENVQREETLPDCHLGIMISPLMNEKLNKIVGIINISKTEFFLEAIHEKLEREEQKVKKIFQGMLKSAEEKEPVKS